MFTGVTAYAMSYWAVGGWLERSAVLVFNTWLLLLLGCAYWFHLRGEPSRKRQWMTRAVAVLLGIATTRPVMGVFFATSSRTHLGPGQFFGTRQHGLPEFKMADVTSEIELLKVARALSSFGCTRIGGPTSKTEAMF